MIDLLSHISVFAQTEPAAPTPGEGFSGLLMLFIFLLVVAGPFILGEVIARLLKLKDISFRLGIVLFALTLGLTPFVYRIANGGVWTDAIRLGIDLAGGTNMVFQVQSSPDKPITNAVMDQMVVAVGRRVNPSGTEELTVRQVGSDRIEIIIPGADREYVESIKRKITDLGELEFAVLANEQDHPDVIRLGKELADDQDDVRKGGNIIASWRPVGRFPAGHEKAGEQKPMPYSPSDLIATRTVKRNGEDIQQFLVAYEKPEMRVTGKYLHSTSETVDDQARPAVAFTFNTYGGHLFSRLTSKYQPDAVGGFERRLAVLLNREIHSAPGIQDVIGQSGIIRGSFTRREVRELIGVLKAGALVVPIDPEPINQFTISPLLGKDVQEKGKRAIMIAAVGVLLFMAVYYFFAGLVADLCLILNLILVLGTMSLIEATFTLPGLAGLVLTIGMAVDANVLIFERIREETERGSSLRMSIHNGFSRAFTTIVDANVTTLITAVVLYMIGTDQVRGFAVTLFIGIVMSMFSALYFGRLIFDIFERKSWIKKLPMSSIVGLTNIDFIGKKRFAVVASLLLIAGGMGALVIRGQDNLDIDFSGGVMVTFTFTEPQKYDEIKEILSKADDLGSSITLEQLTTMDAGDKQQTQGRRYRLRTTVQNVEKVSQAVNQALTNSGHDLKKISMDYTPLQTIAQSEKVETDESESSEDLYTGGHKSKLTFSDVLSPATVVDMLSLELSTLKNADGEPKYDQPDKLINVFGFSSDASTASKFDAMELQVQSEIATDDLSTALAKVKNHMSEHPIFEEVNSFASSVAGEMQQSAIFAMIVSLIAIVGYIWFRFEKITFGLAAVIALVHDVLIVIGMVALAAYVSNTPVGGILDLYDFKINLPMIAAFLTIVGYSLNDTIVVFDRIREVRGKNPELTTEMVNRSLNQTLARTLLTSITTFLVVAILYAMGGEGIHGFAYCLVIGVIVGTYSSVFVASPALLWLMHRSQPNEGNKDKPARAAAQATAE